VPPRIAFKVTKPRRVFALNEAALREAVRLGPGVRGGATSILRHRPGALRAPLAFVLTHTLQAPSLVRLRRTALPSRHCLQY